MDCKENEERDVVVEIVKKIEIDIVFQANFVKKNEQIVFFLVNYMGLDIYKQKIKIFLINKIIYSIVIYELLRKRKNRLLSRYTNYVSRQLKT